MLDSTRNFFYTVNGFGSAEAFAVLFFVIVAIFAAFDFLPPPRVVGVPADRFGQRLLERMARVPAERAHFINGERIAAVVSRAVGARGARGRATLSSVSRIILTTSTLWRSFSPPDVIDLAQFSPVQDHIHRLAVVGHIEPIANLLAVAIQRQRLDFPARS